MTKIGLALGSGSARGYAHIAIIQTLLKAGITPSMVSGSSAGALVGAYFCLHGEVDSLIQKIQKMERKDFLKLVDLAHPKRGLIKGVKIKQFLKEHFFKDATFSKLKIPLVVCATNLKTHEPTYFTKGNLLDAVMASICLPGLFPPYEIRGRYYIDGGVLEPLPVEVLFKKGMAKVIAVNINHFVYRHKQPKLTAISVLSEAFYMMMEKLSNLQCLSEDIFLLQPKFEPGFGDSIKFYNWEPFYRAGEKEIKKLLPKLKAWLS
ncbi:hypothetical protein DRJ48_02875 [Candidatus Woesearchaeota archaeon]|nr:patatin-like phospholipase family protein [Candidatus Woesearchaeota archaeon]RLE42732.1 MAG: hypothetical protein DRJ48_02875 [Candidatus Woesearchaeota archaeon]